MENRSQTSATQFILLGFSYAPQTKIVLFVGILGVYLATLAANSLFIIVTLVDARLHSPMYFFLCNLAFLDLCYSSSNSPTVLQGLLVQSITVTFSQCITQMYISLSFGETECFLLAIMSWDRYVAVCNPLRYQQVMNTRVCVYLAISSWAGGFLISMSILPLVPVLQFCGHNAIDHTFCELQALSRLKCKGMGYIEVLTPIVSPLLLVSPLSLILFTYFKIISTILRMPTAASRKKTVATCGSHLVVVTLFYGTAMGIYLRPASASSSEKDKALVLFYGVVVPALNPLIYTLRNKDVLGALTKLYSRRMVCQNFRT